MVCGVVCRRVERCMVAQWMCKCRRLRGNALVVGLTTCYAVGGPANRDRTDRKADTVTLIRHNVRTGSNQGAHYAHDTERADVNGCYVSGRQDKVLTSQYRPCPQCGGYGALVPIRPLPRKEYPPGSTVPDRYRLHRTEQAAPVAPVETPAPVEEETPAPVEEEWCSECLARGPHRVSCSQYVPSVPSPASTPASGSEEEAASRMAQAMLAALVPEAAKIRDTIAQAVEQVDSEARERNNEALTEAIETLTANFDETVRRLIVPTVIEVKKPSGEIVPIAGTVHEAFQEVLETITARDHQGRPRNVMLVGPVGCGKTTLAEQVSQALEVEHYYTPQVISEHQIMGYEDAGGRYHETSFHDAFSNGGVWLGDEMDSWSPEAALAANGALAGGATTFPNSTKIAKAHQDFYAIAAMNTWGSGADREHVGRNEMDVATLSRYVAIPMDYDKSLETALAGEWTEWRDLVWHVREKARELRMRITAGTREIVHGVALLNNGSDPERVALRVLRRNLGDAEWSKVTS